MLPYVHYSLQFSVIFSYRFFISFLCSIWLELIYRPDIYDDFVNNIIQETIEEESHRIVKESVLNMVDNYFFQKALVEAGQVICNEVIQDLLPDVVSEKTGLSYVQLVINNAAMVPSQWCKRNIFLGVGAKSLFPIFSWREILFPGRNFHFGKWPQTNFSGFKKAKNFFFSKKKKKKKKGPLLILKFHSFFPSILHFPPCQLFLLFFAIFLASLFSIG